MGTYFYRIWSDDEDSTWLNGPFQFHNGEFDGVNSPDPFTITTGGVTVEVSMVIDHTRTYSVTSTATLTPDVINYDLFEVTAQAAAITIANPSTDIDKNDGFVIRLTDNGTGRAITFGNKFRAFGSALPTTTTANKTLYIAFLRNVADDKYDVINAIEEQ